MEESSIIKRRNIFDWPGLQDRQYAPMSESASSEAWEPTAVAPRLIAARAAIGLSKAEFADAIGIDRSSYTKIEKGLKPLLPREAFRIWALYAVDLNFLYLGQLGGLPSNLSSKVISHLTGRKP